MIDWAIAMAKSNMKEEDYTSLVAIDSVPTVDSVAIVKSVPLSNLQLSADMNDIFHEKKVCVNSIGKMISVLCAIHESLCFGIE